MGQGPRGQGPYGPGNPGAMDPPHPAPRFPPSPSETGGNQTGSSLAPGPHPSTPTPKKTFTELLAIPIANSNNNPVNGSYVKPYFQCFFMVAWSKQHLSHLTYYNLSKRLFFHGYIR